MLDLAIELKDSLYIFLRIISIFLLARPFGNIYILFYSHQSFIQVNQKQIEHKHKLKNTKARHSNFVYYHNSALYIFFQNIGRKKQQTNKQTKKKLHDMS